ncbi:hypothetical protein BBJ28_00011581 [Nothophytophthora sp. Chile5]|nr:hypothetical protein BBJ28_00011581 [Nothophytophthora sp. Chile5]
MFGNSSCVESTCDSIDMGNGTYYVAVSCNVSESDRYAYAEEAFGEFNYLLMEIYADSGCETLSEADAFPASGTCEISSTYGDRSAIVSLYSNGSATVSLHGDDTCGSDDVFAFALDSANISSGVCIEDRFKFYTRASTPTASPSTPIDDGNSNDNSIDGSGSGDGSGLDDRHERGARPRSLGGLWDDEVIATARVPREKVVVDHLISRGGGGEVYFGLFNNQQVAVKMLLPATRKSVQHVNAFLAEVKLMAGLEHPRIVQFVGVAWDSLTDLCAVSEYMEGGDLRALLASYEAENHPVGFNRDKVTIALHVAHALTYLHSLAPLVLHRDIKSKNILLSASLEAKLTDFGISREVATQTMTAGVGTSLWMAPEVMLGERYDAKSDVFSFGVVLSELDLHALPYSHGNSDRKTPETVVLQMVALGKLRVGFSSQGPESVATLGLKCVSLDPTERPTAAQALYKLQTILSQEMASF